LNQQQQTQHVSVFTTELFARYLHIRSLSVMKCRKFTQVSFTDENQRFIKSILCSELPIIADVLSLKLQIAQKMSRQALDKALSRSTQQRTLELVELLQLSAVEHLTRYRQLQAQSFVSIATIVTTDFEALYTYKRGDYQRCLQLSTQNVRTLWSSARMFLRPIFTHLDFIQLIDDDIVSLTALTLIGNPKRRRVGITQLTLSLYLVTQCQLKLHHSVTSLAQTLDYINVAQRRTAVLRTLDHLTLKLTERRLMIYLKKIMYGY